MKQQSITNLPLSPDQERRNRMIKYSVAMGIRVLCIIAILFVPGWWKVIPAIGAIFLPYFAVVVANVSSTPQTSQVLRPGNILPVFPGAGQADASADGEPAADEPAADEPAADVPAADEPAAARPETNPDEDLEAKARDR